MHDPLREKIDFVRHRATWAALAYGGAWALASGLFAVLIAGLFDYSLKIDYPPVRILLSLSTFAAIVAAAYYYLYPQVKRRLTDVAVAQQIQQRFPLLLDKLASAVEFLDQDEEDRLAGSTSLRRAVVVEAVADLERYPIREVVNYRSAIRASLVATAGLFVMLVIAMSAPAKSGIALARLANPLGDTVWPRTNDLVFRNPPARIASGSLFEVELIDHNDRLPDDVTVEYRFEDQNGPNVVSQPMAYVDGVMVAQRKNVRRPFSFRAVGGDDETPWLNLEVVEAPRVQTLRVRQQPPAYSGWPQIETSGRIVGIAGTDIEMVCQISKPIHSATLMTDTGESFPTTVSSDGLQVTAPAAGTAPWVIKETGTYWLKLADREQIEGGESDKWQVRVIADLPPSVNIEQPVPELRVTAVATIPFRVFIRDDLAIRDAALKYLRSDESELGEQTIVLFKGNERVAPLTHEQQIAALADGDRRVEHYKLDLAAMNLTPGTQLSVHASAFDYQPAEGKSQPAQRIYIISENDLANRLARRQTSILGDLLRALQRQRDVRGRTTELEIQFTEVGHLKEKDIHQLQGLEVGQREVRRILVGANDGILLRLELLLEELENNKIKTPEMVRQLDTLAALLRRLNIRHLAPIEEEINKARKHVRADVAEEQNPTSKQAVLPGKSPGVAKPDSHGTELRNRRASVAISGAGEHQDHVIRALEQVLGDLQRWDKYRRFARDLAQIESAQGKVRLETESIRASTLGRDVTELTPQQRADLKVIGEKQFELARRFDKVLEGMEVAGANLRQSDPLAAASIADAAHHARTKGISSEMQSAGRNVQRNQVGQAAGRQQAAANHLAEMIDILSNRREQELARLVKKLREAELELKSLADEHKRLKKKLADTDKVADKQQQQRQLKRIARQQQDLKDKMNRLARRLQRLRAEKAGASLAKAAGSVEGSGQSGAGGDSKGANDGAQKAEKELKAAQRKLAQARRQAEAELAAEQLAKLQDQIKALIKRETAVVTETERLEKLRNDQQRLSRAQRASVADLARRQLGVVESTSTMAKSLSAEVFRRTLQRTAAKMQQAAERLGQLDTSAATQRIETQSIAQLELLIQALAKDEGGSQGGGGEGKGGGKQGGERIRSIAEIKLLKLVQEDLNGRVADNRQQIENNVAADEQVDELLEERLELAREQGELADMTFDLLDPGDGAPEDDPDDLPEVNEEQPNDDLLPTIPNNE